MEAFNLYIPVDVIREITSRIDELEDLLNLSLMCKSLHIECRKRYLKLYPSIARRRATKILNHLEKKVDPDWDREPPVKREKISEKDGRLYFSRDWKNSYLYLDIYDRDFVFIPNNLDWVKNHFSINESFIHYMKLNPRPANISPKDISLDTNTYTRRIIKKAYAEVFFNFDRNSLEKYFNKDQRIAFEERFNHKHIDFVTRYDEEIIEPFLTINIKKNPLFKEPIYIIRLIFANTDIDEIVYKSGSVVKDIIYDLLMASDLKFKLNYR